MPLVYRKRKTHGGNLLVTRGFGFNSRVVQQGHTAQTFDEVVRIIKIGRSSAERMAEEFKNLMVWARLTKVNEKPASDKLIEGKMMAQIQPAAVDTIKFLDVAVSGIKSATDNVKISMSRIK